MSFKSNWTIDETVMPKDMNDIGKGLNDLIEKDNELENKKFDKIGGRVTGTVNADNVQVGGSNVYHTGRKPTANDVGALDLTGGTIAGKLAVTSNINTSGAYQISAKNILRGSSNATILSSANSGDIYIRPRGDTDTVAQVIVSNDGTVKADNVQVGGSNVYHTGRKPTPEDIGAVANSGGAMSGELELSATYPMIIKAPTTNNSWARGIWYKNEDKTKNLYGIGIHGANENLNSFYIGNGDSPWINTLFKVNDADAFYKNNKIYHEGKKPTPTEIGAAPTIHSHNDRYYTEEEIDTKLNIKVDKVEGKQLSTNDYTTVEKNKLAGVATGANAYTHPSTHPATIITEDTLHRFVTDAEKGTWNGKASNTVVSTAASGLMSKEDKVKLDGIATGANAYVHPGTHPATIITEDATHRFATDSEKGAWNGKAPNILVSTTANGLMAKEDKVKLDGIATGANAYVHPSSHPATVVTQDATHRFVTDTEKSAWNKKPTPSEIGAITKAEVLNMFYPVGSIYMSVKSTNPGTTMGGTWVAWGSGRVPVGINTADANFNTVEKIGGSSSVSHLHDDGTLVACIGCFDTDIGSLGYAATSRGDKAFNYAFKGLNVQRDIPTSRINHATSVRGNTGSTDVNNLQPYMTCYMWKRTV